MEQSGRKKAQLAANVVAAESARLLANRRLWLHPVAIEPMARRERPSLSRVRSFAC
jgi:hypothetical protein